MAVYGNQLLFFSEQFRMFDYFSMTPQTVSSYTKRTDLGKVKGVFQYVKKGELTRENDTLDEVNVPTLWTRQKLSVGNFFIQREDEIFRIVKPADWTFEGGFNIYVLETFVGDSDVQEAHEYVNLGQNDYA